MNGTIAQILMFAGNFAPRNWMFCDGQVLSISSNTALFSLIGTIYGGDGRTTFQLPELRGRVPMHPGSGPGLPTYQLGQKGGTENITLSTNTMPSHSHEGGIDVTDEDGNTNIADGNILANTVNNNYKNVGSNGGLGRRYYRLRRERSVIY